jgi:hypothetical protein
VRELRRPPLAGPSQRLRWLDGESLCVLRGFWQRCGGEVPSWLTAAARAPVAQPLEHASTWLGRPVILRQYPPAGRLRHWLARLRGRRVTSPGLRQAGLLFRLERYGVLGPRLLAFGQRPDAAGFILFQPPGGAVPIAAWLAAPHPRRSDLLRSAGALLRRLHDADCRLSDPAALAVRGRRVPTPILSDVQPVHACRRLGHALRRRDLRSAVRALGLSGDDTAAFMGGYGDGPDVSPAACAPAQPVVPRVGAP